MYKCGNQRKPVLWLSIIGVIIIFVLIFAMWMGYGDLRNSRGQILISGSEMSIWIKLIFTIVGLGIIYLGYAQYQHQKNLDLRN